MTAPMPNAYDPELIFDPKPLVLTGRYVRLEPLSHDHAADLRRAGSDPKVWRYMPCGSFREGAGIEELIADALTQAATGVQVPFAIIHAASGAAIGSTRYLEIRRKDRALEIGWTWIAPAHQRTPVNTECKLLLLGHAFETLGAVRMQFKTDARNKRSQAAIARIGARQEGVLRKSLIMSDGFVRDTVYFSIVRDQWPAAKRRLQEMLNAPSAKTTS